MTAWDELEHQTLWEITVNGGIIDQLKVSIACFLLAVIYMVIGLYMTLKLWMRR